MFVIVGGTEREALECKRSLPRSVVLRVYTELPSQLPTDTGCLLLFCGGLPHRCSPLPCENVFPAVRICSEDACTASKVHGSRVVPSELPNGLFPTSVGARVAWVWRLLSPVVESLGADDPLPLHWFNRIDPPVTQVQSLTCLLGLSRTSLHRRWQESSLRWAFGNPKRLIDWLMLLRVASARHAGASWEEAARAASISPRTLWRVLDRLGIDESSRLDPRSVAESFATRLRVGKADSQNA